jgi:hypothetical protein
MDKESTEKLIKNTFQNSFDKERYIYFIKNLLKRYDESKVFHLQGCYIPKAFKNFIKAYERIGTYIDPEEKKIDLLIVYLKKETTLDRARTAQRNFVAHYLKERGEKDAGLVAFVSPEEEDWRFSFVKMEYKFEKTPTSDVKVKEEFTAARRYSFLVGKNESSHTAQSCFIDILKNDDYNLKIYELEKTFSIEKVTKEFFEKYRDLFLRIKDSLDEVVKKDEEIIQEFQEKGMNTVDFSKKLLGQIVFLYFLQKKGWFGVPRGKDWGEGDKKFLRIIFDIAKKENRNYFNKFLEPLFYEALRLERPKEYYAQFSCRIPFLNGGLFDPLNDYDWQDTDIEIPNEIFSNNHKTKEGDTGDGILDIFDRYNFTVKEDEPLEKEVAVDPEMLGKVFENLLEIKDRKSKGTYYTPREIVHYMCQQSLINYLFTEVNDKQKYRIDKQNIQMKLSGKPDPVQQNLIIEKDSNIIPKEDIENLIKYGDSTIEHNHTTFDEFSKNPNYKGSYKNYKLPQSILNNAELIDDKLKSIKVCDPAIGSGAFLVGMMNEIIRARNVLTSCLSWREADATKQSRTIYNFKRHAIQNCLYGVDIDPGAVEIAKLRLWLSLIVDEEDINKIKPLPNLDYKIMQGNSLISEFMGVDLDNDKQSNNNTKLFFTDESKELYEMLKVKKDELLNQPNTNKKKILKSEIENLIIKIFEIKLQEQKSDYFKKIREIEEKWERHPVKEEREKEIEKEKDILYRKTGFNLEEIEKQLRQYTSNQKVRPFFPWKLYFSEVFQEKDGFDVVIANPPYGNLLEVMQKKLMKNSYLFSTFSDISSPFVEKSFNLLKNNGDLVFIITYAITFNKNFSKNRALIANGFRDSYIYTFDRDKCRIFKSMSQSVSILKCFNKRSKEKEGIFTSNFFRDTPNIYNIRLHNCDDFLLPKNSKYSQVHRLPKIGEDLNKQILIKLLRFKNVVKTIIFNGETKIWIRTSGNYWYNAFDRKPYKSVEIKPLYVDDIFSDFLIILMNSSIFYFWFRIYGDGRHMNMDILENFPLVSRENILKHKILLTKMRLKFMEKLFSVFDEDRDRFITSTIKSEIDLLDFILGRYFYNLNYKEINYILSYDAEIRGGNQLNTTIANLVLKIIESEDKDEIKEYERQINEMVYKLYNLTTKEIEIVEGLKNK